jgi:hypothetical protein
MGDNEAKYGFFKRKEKNAYDQHDPNIQRCVDETHKFSKKTSYWYGVQLSSRTCSIDFWTPDAPSLERFKNVRDKKRFVGKLADEIDECIKKFKEVAKESGVLQTE